MPPPPYKLKAKIVEFDFTDPTQHGCKLEFPDGSQYWMWYTQQGDTFKVGDDINVTIESRGSTPKGYACGWYLNHQKFVQKTLF